MAVPALQPMIENIGKSLFRRLVEKFAPDAVSMIDWKKDGGDFAAKAFKDLSGDDAMAIRDAIFPQLFNIHTLSDNPREQPRILKCITNGVAKQKWFKTYKLNSPPLQEMVAWIRLEDPDLFENLLAVELAKCQEASGGNRYYLKGNYDGRIGDPNGQFKDELKAYLRAECGVDLHVSVEKNALKKYVRFTVTTDPFPSHKQHFSKEKQDQDKDILRTHPARDAECFYITLHHRTTRGSYFQVRCDYTTAQRDVVANYFARFVLMSDLGVKPEQRRDLSAFLTRPKKFDTSDVDGLVDYRYEGVNMHILSGDKRRNNIYVRRFVDADFYDEIERRRDLDDVPIESRKLVELYLEVVLKTGDRPELVQGGFDGFGDFDGRDEKTYLVTVKSKGFWESKPTATESDEKKIDKLLEKMGLRDISGEKILKQTVRK